MTNLLRNLRGGLALRPGFTVQDLREKGASGFTMIELVVAVVLLGLALTTLISMQSNFAKSYFQEENRTKAALFAQYIMALIEVNEVPADGFSEDGSLEGKLEEVGFFNEKHQREDEVNLEGWNYEINTESIPVLEIEDALRKVELIISWGESEREKFPVVYYMKNNPDQSVI